MRPRIRQAFVAVAALTLASTARGQDPPKSFTLSAHAIGLLTQATHTPLDRSDALDRLGGDRALLAEVARLFLEDCPTRLAAIKTAVDADDAEGIRASAHALKGAAGNLSARGVVDAARTLERIGAEARLGAASAAFRHLSAETSMIMDELRREPLCAR